MSSILEPLVLDFVELVAKEPRPYAEVMDAWRTSCPRLTVWEDALERGLVRRLTENANPLIVATNGGRALLAEHGRNLST